MLCHGTQHHLDKSNAPRMLNARLTDARGNRNGNKVELLKLGRANEER